MSESNEPAWFPVEELKQDGHYWLVYPCPPSPCARTPILRYLHQFDFRSLNFKGCLVSGPINPPPLP